MGCCHSQHGYSAAVQPADAPGHCAAGEKPLSPLENAKTVEIEASQFQLTPETTCGDFKGEPSDVAASDSEGNVGNVTAIKAGPLRGKSVVPLTSRAVHPLFLDAIASMEVELPDRTPSKVKVGDLLTFEVVTYFVRPHTAASGMSLIETLSEIESGNKACDISGVSKVLDKYKTLVGGNFSQAAAAAPSRPYCGPVHYFLSHAWSYRFGHLRDMVKQHYETVTGSEHKYTPVFYWVDIFAVSQNFEGDFKRHPDGDFPSVIKQSQAVVFTIYPWQEPIAPTRIWCLFEALTAVDMDVTLELLLDAQFKKEKVAVLSLEQKFLNTVVKTLDVRNAQATVESDRQQIMRQLNNRQGGVNAFNRLMQQMLRSRMLEALLMRVIVSQGVDGGKQIVDEGATFYNKQLRFRFGRVSDASLELIATALIGNTSVTSLDLSPPSMKGIITHRGATVLADALKQNQVLTELDLSDNPSVGDVGVVAIAQALPQNKREPPAKVQRTGGRQAPSKAANGTVVERSVCVLRTLRLSKVGLEDRGIEALADALVANTTLTSLDISLNSEASAESLVELFKVLHTNRTLKVLNLSGLSFGPTSSATFKALPEMLEKNHSLESLSICACHLNQRACKRLAEAVGKTGLKVLDATGNLFNEGAASELADSILKNLALKDLRLKSCELGMEEATALRAALAKSGVEKLDLSGNHFGKDQWEALGKGYVKVTATVKIEAPKVTSSSARSLNDHHASITHGFSKTMDEVLVLQEDVQVFKMSQNLAGRKHAT